MENSTKKSGGVVIPKRKRSLDLKSLYESRFSEVGGGEKKDSGENEQVDVKKKKRKNRKEVSLSSLESDANKRRKEDGNGAKSDLGFRDKLDGLSKELHGISLSFGSNGSSFNIPKRPRGSVGRKHSEGDQGDSEPLRLSISVDCVGSFKADVSKSEDKGGPGDQLVEPVTFHAAKDGISKSRFAGKFVGSNKFSKPKVDSKPTGNSSGSGVNLKEKGGADGFIDRVGAFKAEVTKSENKGDPSDQSIRPVTINADNNVSGKVVGVNKKSKLKLDPKSTMNPNRPNVKKVGADENVECVDKFKPKVTKSKNKGGTNDQPGRPVTLSVGNGMSGKVVGLKKKSKQKADPKSTINSSGSNEKLKKKVEADECVERVGAFQAEVTNSEDKGVPNDLSVKSVTLSPGNDVVRKNDGLSKKSKQKVDPKSRMKSSSSNVKLKKMGLDEAADHTGPFVAEIIKSNNKGGPIDQPVSPVNLSAGKDEAGKFVGVNKKFKWKADTKSTMNSSSSNGKLKKKVGADEPVDRVGESETAINASEGKGAPHDQSVRSVSLSSGKDEARKVVGLNKKSKGKTVTKSTMNSSSSNVKLKKKVGADEAVDRVGEFESEINSSEHKGGPNDQSVRSVSLSVGKDEADKLVGSNKKSKRKANPKPTTNSSSSNVKLKTKMATDEAVDRVGAFEAEDKGGLNDQSVSPDTISARDEEVRKVIGLKKKSMRKMKPRSTMNSNSSNLKLKEGTDEAVDRLGAGEVTKSGDKGGPNDLSDRLVTLAAGKDRLSNSKLAKTNVGSKTKYKRKADPKITMSPSSSNKKLKVGADEAVARVAAFINEVTKPVYKGSPIDQLVRPVTLSAGKGGMSNSRLAGKLVGSSTKSKRKADAKSTLNSSSSNAKLKQQVVADEVKGKPDGQSDSVAYVVKESTLVVNNGDVPSKKRPRKKNDLVIDGNDVGTSVKNSEPAVARPVSDSPFIDSLDDDDDDDDDLEQNAARMLSSRFDPSCTGFSSKRKPSVSQRVDESSLPISSDWDSTSRRVKSSGGGESDSDDDNIRELRPRGGDKGKGVLRKRRHFYEIPTRDLDPSWFLKRKIKIFWPLDESWYFGHLTDYHSEAKLHHLKYDDGEEEWVNLEEENFRLLLHRFEIPGKEKSRKPSTVVKDTTHAEETVPPADNDNYIGSDPDSEPIASWMASLSQRVKDLSKSSKRRKKSQNHFPIVSALSSVKTDNSNGNANASRLFVENPLPLLNVNHAVYVRKKHQKRSAGSSSLSRGAKARGSASWPVTLLSPDMISLPTTNGDMFGYDCVEEYHKQLWSTFNNVLLESKVFEIQICLPLLPYLEFLCGVGSLWMLHDIFMLHHGVIITTSSAVFLEMLVIDSNHGLKSLLFEGFLMQALAIVFRILTVFSHSDEDCSSELKVPLTSIRFRLSNVNDLRKQHVFEAYCFSKLQSTKWLYLETKILQQCLLIKQLSSSECTYGNIKELESGRILQPCKSLVASELSSRENLRKKFGQGLLPMGQSDFSLTGKPENVLRFSLSSSAASNSFLSLQLLLLMEHGSAGVNLQHQDPLWSPEGSGNGGVPDCSQFIEQENRQSDLSSYQQDLEMGVVLASDATENTNSFDKLQKGLSSDQQVDMPLVRKDCISRQTSDVSWNVNDDFGFKSNTVRPRISSKRRRSSTISSLLGCHSPVSADSQPNFMRDGFSNGPRKPRTQVQYTLPFAGYDVSTKQEMPSPRSIPCKRIRRASLKRISDGSGNNQKKLELLTCLANVLVTRGDKGWRESGAHIVLEFSDHNEWRLAVKLSGVTKFSYKVTHILQPGSTNRYSHTVIWKGGKDWTLEFLERSQWLLFKEMYEECFNRNIRAASVKNIPIPGVRPVVEGDDYGEEVPFVRNSIMYFRQVQTDAEMAMDPSRILYDMDTVDEQWLMTHKDCNDKNLYEEISDEFFEMAMDMFEKVSYAQRRENLTDAEIEEIAIVIGSVEAAKLIYLHWRQKREKMCMPLIRHLQPPPWQRYQKQMKEWEHSVARSGQEKLPLPEKPPMFAFCFKPRGLDVPNKPSKQRSHRRLSVSGLHLASSGDPSLLVSGRRSNRHVYGDEKALYASPIHDASDVSPSLHPSTRAQSSVDAHFTLSTSASEWKVNNNNCRKAHKNKRKKLKASQRTIGESTNGVQQWNVGPSDMSGQSHYYFEGPRGQGGGGRSRQLNISDLHEFQAREALGVSQNAHVMAKFKRDRAQRMFCKADMVIHKAVSVLMQAEAMKASSEVSIGGIVN